MSDQTRTPADKEPPRIATHHTSAAAKATQCQHWGYRTAEQTVKDEICKHSFYPLWGQMHWKEKQLKPYHQPSKCGALEVKGVRRSGHLITISLKLHNLCFTHHKQRTDLVGSNRVLYSSELFFLNIQPIISQHLWRLLAQDDRLI